MSRNKFLAVLVAVLVASSTVRADIRYDNCVGPQCTLTGDMILTDVFGQQVGANLFFSFTFFDVETGQSATFTSNFTGATDNVIGRVTGPGASLIDGPLACTIPDANLWLINPDGMIFGQNATLDVQGSFHASTADYVLMEDGTRFEAAPPPGATLTMADPVGFGFLGPDPAPITVSGANLSVPAGAALSLVGGGIELTDAALTAAGGRIDIAGLASAGEVTLDPSGISVDGIDSYGDITLTSSQLRADGEGGGAVYIRGGSFVMQSASEIASFTLGDLDGIGVLIEADSVAMSEGSRIETSSEGGGNAGSITVDAAGAVSLVDESALLAGAFADGAGGSILVEATDVVLRRSGRIRAGSFASGDAGDITVDATGTITIDAEGIEDALPTGILSNARAEGAGGDLVIETGNLEVLGSGVIAVDTFGSGDGGNITINATDTVTVRGETTLGTFQSAIAAETFSSGTSREIVINAANLEVLDGGFIGTRTRATSSPGSLTVDATVGSTPLDHVVNRSAWPTPSNGMSEGTAGGVPAGASAGDGGSITLNVTDTVTITSALTAISSGEGAAGDIVINTGNLDVLGGGFVGAGAFGSGDGGNITVNAADTVTLAGSLVSGITVGSGSGGDVVVDAAQVRLIDGGVINVRTGGSGDGGSVIIRAETVTLSGTDLDNYSFIDARTFADGDAGDITIEATDLTVSDTAAIATTSLGSGDGGEINVRATQVTLAGESPFGTGIFANAIAEGNGGDIRIEATDVTVRDGGRIFTASAGSGDAGDITVRATQTVTLDGGSTQTGIAAFTAGEGNGGDIRIEAADVLVTDQGQIDVVTQGSGDAGSVTIEATGTVAIFGQNVPSQGTVGTGVSADTEGAGAGGDITIRATHVVLADEGVLLAGSDEASGNAGNITVIASTIEMSGGVVATRAPQAAGGSIDIQASQSLNMVDSRITTSAGGVSPGDDGGNITIARPEFLILNSSEILASANAGNGGNILISAGAVVQSADSRIDASSQQGVDGVIDVDSPNQVTGSVAVLETPVYDISDLVEDRCEAQQLGERSSFTVEGQSGMPPTPDDYLSSPAPAGRTEREERP